jgi:hypothetical protein
VEIALSPPNLKKKVSSKSTFIPDHAKTTIETQSTTKTNHHHQMP